MTQPRLKVFLLGTPLAMWEDQPLIIPRRVTRMLLFYLAARGDAVSRSELISILWQDLDDTLGRQRLRETLNKLRHALPDASLLITNNALVGLNPNRVDVDLIEFKRLVNQAGPQVWKIPPDQPLPDEILQPLRQAVRLWRSPSFMAGADILDTLSMNEWFRVSAEQSVHLLERIAERLSDHELIAGNPESALDLIEIALVCDPFSETLIERKLGLLIRLGRTLQASQEFREYRQKLLETTGLSPGSSLQTIMDRLNQKSAAVRLPAPKLQWEVRPSAQTAFVGRQKYLSLLRQAYFRSTSLILLGESGQGKTRLLEEFSANLKPAPLILLAKCRVTSQNLPLQPLIDALRRSIPLGVWQDLPRPVTQALAPLFPELIQSPPTYSRPGANPGEQTRTHIFEALRQVLIHLEEHTIPLLIVDDAQWADETTLAALAYLMQNPPFNTHGMVLLAARVEEQTASLRDWIAAMPASVQVLHLGAMNLRETTNLATQILGKLPNPHLVERLSQETGGNTFFILEILHALVAQAVDTDANPEIPLPLASGITFIIQSRLRVLQPTARQLLEAAAVTGSEFSLEVVCQAGGFTKSEAADALVELEERYLVEPVSLDLPDVRYRFIHDKVREALLLTLNPLRLQVLHKQVAEAILAESGVQAYQRAAELANHFEMAGDWEQAFPWWVKAMERGRSLGARAEAAESLHHAERIIERHYNQLDENLICELYQSWSVICHIAHQITALEDASARLLRLGELLNSQRLKGSAYLILTALNLVQTQFANGERNAQQAIYYLEGSGDLFQLTYARASLGLFQYLQNQVNTGAQTLEIALRDIQNPRDQRELMARGHIYYHLGLVRMLKGWPKIGCLNARLSMEDNRSIGLPDGMITAYSLLTISSYFCMDLQNALDASQNGLELAIQYQSLRMIGYLHTYRGMVLLALGDLDEFQSHIAQAIELNSRYQYYETLFTDYRILGDAYLNLRDYPRALQELEQSRMGGPDLFLAPDFTFRYHVVKYLLHRTTEEREKLQQVLQYAEEVGLGMVALVARATQCILLAIDQDWAAAEREAKRILEQCQQQDATILVPSITLHLAQAEMNLGQVESAILRLESILVPEYQPLHTWTEIELLCTLNAALHLANRPTQATRQRLESALADRAAHCTHPDFLPSFEAYREKVLLAAQQFQPLTW